MFKELFPIVERAPLMLLITLDGDKLRVTTTQKKDEEDDFVPLNLSIVATPEELDRELPLAIAEGAALLSAEAPKSVADQVKGQVEQAKTAEETADTTAMKKKPAATKPAPKPRVAKAKARKTAAPKPAKTTKPAKAAGAKKKRAKTTSAAAATTPEITPLLTSEKLEAAAASETAPAPAPAGAATTGIEQLASDLAQVSYSSARPPEVAPEAAAGEAEKPRDPNAVDLFSGV